MAVDELGRLGPDQVRPSARTAEHDVCITHVCGREGQRPQGQRVSRLPAQTCQAVNGQRLHVVLRELGERKLRRVRAGEQVRMRQYLPDVEREAFRPSALSDVVVHKDDAGLLDG